MLTCRIPLLLVHAMQYSSIIYMERQCGLTVSLEHTSESVRVSQERATEARLGCRCTVCRRRRMLLAKHVSASQMGRCLELEGRGGNQRSHSTEQTVRAPTCPCASAEVSELPGQQSSVVAVTVPVLSRQVRPTEPRTRSASASSFARGYAPQQGTDAIITRSRAGTSTESAIVIGLRTLPLGSVANELGGRAKVSGKSKAERARRSSTGDTGTTLLSYQSNATSRVGTDGGAMLPLASWCKVTAAPTEAGALGSGARDSCKPLYTRS